MTLLFLNKLILSPSLRKTSYISYALTMPLELRPMTKEDAQEAAALVVASYKNNTFRAIAFPTGMNQASVDKMVEGHQKAVDDPDKYSLKVVDTDNHDKMAECAVLEYTKAMTDEEWERSKKDTTGADPAVDLEIVGEFFFKEQVAKQRIMGHERWFGEFTRTFNSFSVPSIHIADPYLQ